MALVFICEKDPEEEPGGTAHHTDVLMRRCPHCMAFAVSGYRCSCGTKDIDPADALPGHGIGECVDSGQKAA